jgi:hypothetical protein
MLADGEKILHPGFYVLVPGNIDQPLLNTFAHVLTKVIHMEKKSFTKLSATDCHVG